jgi:hypothetical protein
MTSFTLFLQDNYGVLVLAAITFALVQSLTYVYRWQVARLSRAEDSDHQGEDETCRKPVAVEESSRQSENLARMQEDIRQLRHGLRLIEARLTGKSTHARPLAASALARHHTGGLRHKRSRMAG